MMHMSVHVTVHVVVSVTVCDCVGGLPALNVLAQQEIPTLPLAALERC